jgi:PKD repeat protein
VRQTAQTGITQACTRILFLAVFVFGSQVVNGLTVSLPDQHPGQIGLNKAGPMAKVDPMLSKVFAEYSEHNRKGGAKPFKSGNPFLQIGRGKILVDAVAANNGEILLKDLRGLGLQKGGHYGPIVSGRLPIGVIDKAAALKSLRFISASVPIINTGYVTSQGDYAMHSDSARSGGVDGAGTLVGVLSDSFAQQTTGITAATDIASDDLPVGTLILDDSGACTDGIQQQECTDEGRAMAQIIHDIAPGASIAFHTAYNGIADFANGIQELADAGADVIVDDVIYLGEPMYQDGAIAKAVDNVAGDGVAYFSAAGNMGRDSYEHAFYGSGEILYIDILGIQYPAGEMHDFDPSPEGTDTLQRIDVPEGQCMILMVQWDSPFGSAALGTGTQNDLDVWLVNADGTEMITFDAHENIPAGEPVEAIQFCNDGLLYPVQPYVQLIIALWDGAPPGLLKYVVFGNASVEYPTHSGTLYGHANANGAEAVGAAYYMDTPAFGTTPPVLEDFSSSGGVPILLDGNGSLLPVPDVRAKPGLVAPDGVNTTFFYPSTDRDGDGKPDFSGTSAAAPHAAGVAALMLDFMPAATPTDIYAALRSTATDMGDPGFDFDSGYGLIQADAAMSSLTTTGNATPNAGFNITSTTDLEVSFTDTSYDTDGSIVEWGWDFGGDGVSYNQSPTHIFSGAGTYTVTLTVTDNGGAMDTTSQDVTVSAGTGNTAPIASFSYACNGKDCNFLDLSSDPDGFNTSWDWDFGDGESSTAQSPSHSYNSQGTYTVVLVVTDNSGDTGTVSTSIRVKNRGNISGIVGGSGGGDTGGTIEAERGRKKCSDGIDNDLDGLIDGADPDCQ